MGNTTNQLSEIEAPNAGDLLALWSTNNGSTRKLSFSNLALWIAGAMQNMSVAGYVKVPPVTVANLPSATVAGAGARAMVSDANAATFNSVVAAGGANIVPVFSDGTAWRIG
jgi:hypothetical protein